MTIAGYSMVDSKLKTLSEADTTITEYVEDTRHDYYISLMYIIILNSHARTLGTTINETV